MREYQTRWRKSHRGYNAKLMLKSRWLQRIRIAVGQIKMERKEEFLDWIVKQVRQVKRELKGQSDEYFK